MIKFNNTSFQYSQGNARGRIEQMNLKIQSGEVVLLCGESGCGKTTITRMINGLIPHYYEGELDGEVIVDGKCVSEVPLYDLSDVVGSVFQNPRTQFFTVDTTSELAFGCENLGMEPMEIEKRIKGAAEELKIENLLNRSLFALSGGEKQKIACASVSAMEPEVFALDEPSSNLDFSSIGELRKVLLEWKKAGKTMVIAEHRLYYLMDIVDRVLYMKNGAIQSEYTMEELKGLSYLELQKMGLRSLSALTFSDEKEIPCSAKQAYIRDFAVSYQKKQALYIEELAIPQGAIVAVVGNNGAGKTSFANCMCGLLKDNRGSLYLEGKSYDKRQRLSLCYMVMQDVNHQLFTESVRDEIILSLGSENDKNVERANKIMRDLNIEDFAQAHPMSLSGGQKQRVAIASAVASDKQVIVFDEPTSGLDYRHMREVAANLKELSAMGKTLFIITHDPELIAQCCNYFVFMEQGEVRWSDGWNQISRKRLSEFFSTPIEGN